MDLQESFDEMERAIDRDDLEAALVIAEDFRIWVSKGGLASPAMNLRKDELEYRLADKLRKM